MAWVRAAVVLLGCVLLPAWPGRALEVSILRPRTGVPVLGQVEVELAVSSAEPVRRVELFVDGELIGELSSPPYRWLVDVGEANDSHRFEVEAEDAAGERASEFLVTPAVRIDEAIELELQQLYVTVTRGGEPVEDLDRGDFTVLDEGERQKLVTFERGDVPLTALLLVDASDSMRGRRLETALGSTRVFIDGMAALDQAMLLLFSDRVVHATPFTGFSEVLVTALHGRIASGGTALCDFLYAALKLLEGRPGRPVVVMLSDGIDSASVLEMADVRWVARRSQALIYWLRLPHPGWRLNLSTAWRDAEGFRRELDTLENIVDGSGGQIVLLESLDQAPAAFSDLLAELRSQYVLGYYPSQRRDDGSWHPVRVMASGHNLEVRYRQGYVDY